MASLNKKQYTKRNSNKQNVTHSQEREMYRNCSQELDSGLNSLTIFNILKKLKETIDKELKETQFSPNTGY